MCCANRSNKKPPPEATGALLLFCFPLLQIVPLPLAVYPLKAMPPTAAKRPPRGSVTDVEGITVGHFTHHRRPTGCTVVLAEQGAVAGVDVRGGAPGTRETDLLRPEAVVQQVHAVVLSGGSAYGLATADGVMRYLEEKSVGFRVGAAVVPIVPAAILFDLNIADPSIRPDAASGFPGDGIGFRRPRSARKRGCGRRRDGRQALRNRAGHEGRLRQCFH